VNVVREKVLKEAWQALRVGDHISDADLLAMHKQLKAAQPYLEDRLPEFYLAFCATNRDVVTIEGYIDARGLRR